MCGGWGGASGIRPYNQTREVLRGKVNSSEAAGKASVWLLSGAPPSHHCCLECQGNSLLSWWRLSSKDQVQNSWELIIERVAMVHPGSQGSMPWTVPCIQYPYNKHFRWRLFYSLQKFSRCTFAYVVWVYLSFSLFLCKYKLYTCLGFLFPWLFLGGLSIYAFVTTALHTTVWVSHVPVSPL